MKFRWPGVILVAALVIGILVLKSGKPHNPPAMTTKSTPAVILVADLSEADENGDRCAEIIRAVRDSAKRGVRVEEFSPDSKSDLLRQYRVLTIPTVLLLDKKGDEIARFEGENADTVKAAEARLANISGTRQ